MGTMAAMVGGGVISGGLSILGARQQRKAQKRQTAAIESIEARKLGLSREQFEFAKEQVAEGKPLRDALQAAGLKTIPKLTENALQALTGIQQDLSRDPGTGQLFQRGLEKGTRSLFQNLGAFGLADSSAAGTAVGEFSGNLLSSDIQSIRNLRLQAASMAPGSPESTLGVAGAFNQGGLNLEGQASQLGAQRAGVLGRSPSAGLFQDLAGVGSTIATVGALKHFSGGRDTPSGGAVTGASQVPSFNLSTGRGF